MDKANTFRRVNFYTQMQSKLKAAKIPDGAKYTFDISNFN